MKGCKTGGRKKGARNKRTIIAVEKPDALDHLIKVMTAPADDQTVTPELRLRAAVALAQYQHPKPWAPRAVGQPIDLEPPKSAQEARDAIARLVSMIAKAEIDGEHGARIIAGLQAFLAARAAELEAEVEKYHEAQGS